MVGYDFECDGITVDDESVYEASAGTGVQLDTEGIKFAHEATAAEQAARNDAVGERERRKPWAIERNIRFYHLDMQRKDAIQQRVRTKRASAGSLERELAAHCTFSPHINGGDAAVLSTETCRRTSRPTGG